MPDMGNPTKRPLSEVFLGEAVEFTPWLSSNLDRLASELGFELEPDDLEVELSDGTRLGETLFEVDDDGKLDLLKEAAEAHPDNDNLKTAFALMAFEVEQRI